MLLLVLTNFWANSMIEKLRIWLLMLLDSFSVAMQHLWTTSASYNSPRADLLVPVSTRHEKKKLTHTNYSNDYN